MKDTFVNTLCRKRSEFYNISVTNTPFYKNEIGRQIFVRHYNIKFPLNQFKVHTDRLKGK